MSDSQEWRRALELLDATEAAELELLMQRRVERMALPAARRKRKADAPPAKPDGRIYYVSSDPHDRLADFRARSNGTIEPPSWIDGI